MPRMTQKKIDELMNEVADNEARFFCADGLVIDKATWRKEKGAGKAAIGKK